MKRVVPAILVVVALGLAFAAGSWVTWRASRRAPAHAAGVAAQRYTCPMHPAYSSDHEGDCPSCGMRLVPASAGEPSSSGSGLPPNVLKVSAERQQLIGLRLATVETAGLGRTVRTVGRVAVDENRVYKLVATAEGLVRSLSPTAAGGFVRKEQVLLTFYSTDFLSAQQAYFYALTTLERVSADRAEASEQLLATNAQLRSALDGLRNLGMTEAQLSELAKSRKLTRDIDLRSPVTGYVLARDVFPAQRLERGRELYRIADLSRVWVLADLFEGDAQYVRPGTRMRVSLAYREAAPIEARVSDVLPQSDRTTRTARVRLEVDNRDLALRPDMFVDVELPVALPPAVTVPSEAVVDSGRSKTVFVARGNGYFEPRRVETGWRSDDRVQILSGLVPGERVVASGTFLLDSESRMRAAGSPPQPVIQPPPEARPAARTPARDRAAGAGKDGVAERIAAAERDLNATADDAAGRSVFATDPVCGAEIETTSPGALTATYNGRVYYFFSDECKAAFEKDPAAYAGPETPAPGSKTIDPVCGMEVDAGEARKAGLMAAHEGHTYSFCSKLCRDQFTRDPRKFLAR